MPTWFSMSENQRWLLQLVIEWYVLYVFLPVIVFLCIYWLVERLFKGRRK